MSKDMINIQVAFEGRVDVTAQSREIRKTSRLEIQIINANVLGQGGFKYIVPPDVARIFQTRTKQC